METNPESATEVVPSHAARRLGRYTILEDLARGGMAQLYVARKDGARELCVLKRLRDDLETNEIAAKRFQREAVVASLLDHPNIVRTLDAGIEGGVFCIASEFIPGVSLAAMLAKLGSAGTRLPPEVALSIARSVLDGLEYAHDLKDREGRPLDLVHRDLSPRNIILSFAGEVKIIDFGVVYGRVDEFKTAPGVVVGSFEYMSPEQVQSLPVDRRSDLYTVATVLYEMLAGEPVVNAEKMIDMLASIVRDAPRPLSCKVTGLSAMVLEAVERGLAKAPEARWPTAAAFKAALGPAQDVGRAAYLKAQLAEEEKSVIALLERSRRSFEAEVEEISRPPQRTSSDKLSQYEPTALVARKRARAGQRDRAKLSPEEREPAAFVSGADADKTQVTGETGGSQFTKLGAVVLDMPGEPAPLSRSSVVRVEMELLRRSNRFLRFSVITLGVVAVGLGLAAFVITRHAPPELPARPAAVEAPESGAHGDVPAAVAREREEPSAAPAEAAHEVERTPPAPSRRRIARATPPPERAEKVQDKPVEAAPSHAVPPEIAHLRRLLDELRASPKDVKRFDKLMLAVKESASGTPEGTRRIVRTELNAAEINLDVDALARAVDAISRAKAPR